MVFVRPYNKGWVLNVSGGLMIRIAAKLAFLVFGILFLSTAGLWAQESSGQNAKYEVPTLSNLSKLYWAISKLDLNNKTHLDNYMLINECELYRDFFHNELEWDGIRNIARKTLQDSRTKFPVNLEYAQLVRLAEYNPQTEFFDILDADKIMGGRSFEVLAKDIDENVCGKRRGWIEGYPKGLYVELNRPVILDKIPVPKAKAEEFIEKKLKIFNKLPVMQQNKKTLYNMRDAYVSMKIKVLAYDRDVRIKSGGAEVVLAKVYATLDGYSIYGDKDKRTLLFTEDFRSKKARPPADVERRKRYQERLKKYGITGDGQPSLKSSPETGEKPQ